MRHIADFRLFEKKEQEKTKALKMIEDFKKEFGTELDESFAVSQIELLKKAFGHFDKKFLKNKVHKIMLDDIEVHGRWKDTPKKKHMTLSPRIFEFEKEFENGIDDIPYKEFIIVHEIGHCIDNIEKVSFSKKWQSISGWKKCDIDEAVPEGYDRFIRKKRKNSPDPKRSGWIYREGSKFCRRYSSKSPREDFADSFAFAIFKCYSKFEGDQGKEKLDIVKKVIDQIS